MEDGALGDAGLARELRRGGGRVAALGEQAARGRQQARALLRGLAPAGGRARPPRPPLPLHPARRRRHQHLQPSAAQ